MTRIPQGDEGLLRADSSSTARASRWWWAAAVVATAVLACAVFIRMTAPGVSSDIMLHSRIAMQEVDAGRWFTYTIWSTLVVVASGRDHVIGLRAASVILLTAAVVAKLFVARRVLRAWGASARRGAWVAVGLVVAAPIVAPGVPVRHGAEVGSTITGAIYLGRLTPTLWHNSTSIASIPLVLIAADAARRALLDPTTRTCRALGLWMALVAVVKPNFVLVALPVMVPTFAWQTRDEWLGRVGSRSRSIVAIVWSAGPAAAIAATQFFLIRSDPFVVPSRFSWDPLRVWSYYAPPLLAILQSLLFPAIATIVVVVLDPHRQRWLWCCWCITGVALLQLALLGERNRRTGDLIVDGNWFWGAHAAVTVLFVAAAAALPAAAASRERDGTTDASTIVRRPIVVRGTWVLFGLHVVSGLLYVSRLFRFPGGFAS
jgi:hypothetical protein